MYVIYCQPIFFMKWTDARHDDKKIINGQMRTINIFINLQNNQPIYFMKSTEAHHHEYETINIYIS